MKNKKTMAGLAFLLTMICGLCACSQQDCADEMVPENTATDENVHHARMILQGERPSFDDTRAASAWKDGDKVYLRFSVSGQWVQGTATYKASANEWDIQYYGTITQGEECTCEAFFFDGAASATSSAVTLDIHTGVYQDTSASYLLKDGVIRVTATLSPRTGRFRFKGTAGAEYITSGFSHYTQYDPSTGVFYEGDAYASGTIGADGYSAYYYGYFADESQKVLAVRDNSMQYTKTMNENALKKGHSGSLRLPTKDSQSGWTATMIATQTFVVKGISFKMIRVEGGTFTMGATAEQSNGYTPFSYEKPTHSVTLSSYAIAETEVTQALWYAVMGYKPTSSGSAWSSSYGLGDSYPAYYISYNDCKEFVTKLNQLTGQRFRMPTEAEWEFAARGGNKSKGYIFSGSNTVGNVAWYSGNSSSKTHPVKEKTANELGIYDMSGNVYEWCADWYGSYSSTSQTNPTGPATGSDRVLRGGNWITDATYCRVSYRTSTPSYRIGNYGFRLAL